MERAFEIKTGVSQGNGLSSTPFNTFPLKINET